MIPTCEPEWLIADIIDNCPDAPIGTVRRCITKAVKDFAKAGMIDPWISIPTQACVPDYPFEDHIPEGFHVEYIKHVKWCGKCIEPIEECDRWCPTGYKLDDLNHLTLYGGYVPSCDAQDDLQVHAILSVDNDNCEVPCDTLERFENELFSGAMGHLLMQKDKDWSDIRMAREYKQEFRGCVAAAKCLVSQNMNPCNTRIKPECIL